MTDTENGTEWQNVVSITVKDFPGAWGSVGCCSPTTICLHGKRGRCRTPVPRLGESRASSTGSCPKNWHQGRRLILMPFRELVRTRKRHLWEAYIQHGTKKGKSKTAEVGKSKVSVQYLHPAWCSSEILLKHVADKSFRRHFNANKTQPIVHIALFPQGHNHSLWGPGSLLSPAQEQLRPAPRSSASRGRTRSRAGAQGRTPSWAQQQQNRGRKVWFAAPRLGHMWRKCSQAVVTLLLYLMIQLQLRTCIIPPALLETFPISFRDEKSIWRGAQKDPLPAVRAERHQQVSIRKSIPRLPVLRPLCRTRAARSQLPGPGQTHTRRVLHGRESGMRTASASLAGAVRNPWQSTKPKALLKSASGIWQLRKGPPQCSCAFTALCEGGCGSWGPSTWWERTAWQEDVGQTQKHYHWSKHC